VQAGHAHSAAVSVEGGSIIRLGTGAAGIMKSARLRLGGAGAVSSIAEYDSICCEPSEMRPTVPSTRRTFIPRG
jgi:hypothetical protein